MYKSKALILLVGIAGGFGLNEIRHPTSISTPPVAKAPSSTDVLELAASNKKEREYWCQNILNRLEHESLSTKDKVRYIRVLGSFRCQEAIPYLVKNIDFEDEESITHMGSPLEWPDRTCFTALMSLDAVPSLVDAYITGLLDTWQMGDLHVWLRRDDRRARVAYVYAQGYVFATNGDPHRREAAVHLIRALGDKVSCAEMPYPPSWLAEP